MSLFNHKTSWIEITVKTAVCGGEFEDTIVGVGDATGVILLVTVSPNHLLRGSVHQHLHRSSQHHTLEAVCITEVNTGFWVGFVMGYAQGESICGEIENLDTLAYTG